MVINYSESEVFFLLILITAIIAATGLYLGLLILLSRYLTLRDKKAFNELKTKYSELIFEAMHDEEKSNVLFERLNKNPKQVSIVSAICKDLLEEVEGDAEKKVKGVLRHPEIKKHYLSYLNSFNNRRKVKGLLYLKDIQTLPHDQEAEVFKLLEHRLHYLSHAGALVILASKKSHLHEKTLIFSCQRSENCRYTVIELLWEYWNNNFVSRETKEKCFQSLLGSESISLEMKALLVRIISTFNEHHFSIYFHEILKFILGSEQNSRNFSFIASLINALGKSRYVKAEKEVIKAFSIKSKEIRIAVIKALVQFKTDNAVSELIKIYKTSTEYLKKEISFTIEHDDELTEQIITSEAKVNLLKN